MSTEQLISSPIGDASQEDEVVQVEGNDGISIEFVDDTPEEDQNRKPPAGYSDPDHESELTNVSQSVQKRIKKLKYDFHQERRGKDAAVRMRDESVTYAQKVAEENRQLRELVSRGEQVLIDEVKSRTSNDVNSAKERLKRAHEEGDADALVEAQESLASASYDARKALEYAPVTPPATDPSQAAQQPPAQSAGRPVQPPDPQAAAWAQRNPWFRKDREMTAIALAAHEDLTTRGISVNSDEYYQGIDQRIRTRFPEKFEGQADAGTEVLVEAEGTRPTGTPQKPSSVVAPARRTTGAKSRKVRMNETQKALAKKLGVTPEQYAIQVIELEKANG